MIPGMPKRKQESAWIPPWREFMDPYVQMWRALTPAQRLSRSWRLRTRIKNLEAVHDAKTFPKWLWGDELNALPRRTKTQRGGSNPARKGQK